MADYFRRFAHTVSLLVGSAWAFVVAALLIVAWAVTGPLFHFSDTWQLVINTSTTIITFLMVFIIQNTQNRDGKAIQLKLDELVRAVKGARNDMIDLESLSDEQLKGLQAQFESVREQADRARKGKAVEESAERQEEVETERSRRAKKKTS